MCAAAWVCAEPALRALFAAEAHGRMTLRRGAPLVETERLLLRPNEAADFERYYEMLSDPVAKQYTGGATRLHFAERRALFLAEECGKAFSKDGAEFAVIRKADGQYLGYCGFRFNEALQGQAFLYGYHRDCWGQGYGTEAARAALAFFLESGLVSAGTLLATVEAPNAPSIRLLEKLGFRREATLPAEAEGFPLLLYRFFGMPV